MKPKQKSLITSEEAKTPDCRTKTPEEKRKYIEIHNNEQSEVEQFTYAKKIIDQIINQTEKASNNSHLNNISQLKNNSNNESNIWCRSNND